MAENEDKKFILQRILGGAEGPTGPLGPTGPTGPPGGTQFTSLVTHDGLERNNENLATLLDELLYVVLTGSNFSHGLGLRQIGSTVVNLPLVWQKNKATVTSQTLTGSLIGPIAVGPTATSYTIVGINISTDGSWTLTIDDGTTIVQLVVTLTFTNKVHWGARPAGTFNDAFILGLANNGLQTTRNKVFTVTAGASDKIFFALPSDYGTPIFTVGGFQGGFFKAASNLSHTNTSGHVENYDIWESDSLNLGTTTVNVT